MKDEPSPKKQTEKSSTRKRCVNLDWLEVHCREPLGQPHTADYFRMHGIEVQEREYGTRVYREMFTLFGSDGLPAIEVRRNPASQGLHGIHDAEETHIRLVNRMCYYDDAAEKLQKFLDFHHYIDVRISRVDVCMDFVNFDFGDDPGKFLARYLQHKFSKINVSRINVHGVDTWEGQTWNSVKWGSPKSCVSTKMYNKTMELYDRKSSLFLKPYIRQAWLLCGFIDDAQHVTKDGQLVNVWRVEFSLTSSAKNWCPIELNGKPNKKYSLRNTLDMYDSRAKLITMFASLSAHYFRFKEYKEGVRKDRCKDKRLFDFTSTQIVYKLDTKLAVCGDGDKKLQRYNRLLLLLQNYSLNSFNSECRAAADTLINALKEDNIKADMKDPWNKDDLELVRTAYLRYLAVHQVEEVELSEALKEFLNINPRYRQFFDHSLENEPF